MHLPFNRLKLIHLIFICFALQACQLFSVSDRTTESPKTSLESLQPAVLNLPKTQLTKLDVSDVIDSYSKLLPLLSDPEKQLKVLHRLADLKLQKGELLMAEQVCGEN